MEYPESIQLSADNFKGKSCLYVIEVEPSIYKFGITVLIRDRLRKHYRDLRFKNIVSVYDCVFDPIMSKTEYLLKKLAADTGELIRKYNQTEIINTNDITRYLDFVNSKIIELQQNVYPINSRDRKKHNIINPVVIAPVINQPEVNNKKCYLCGKIFRTPSNLLTHQKRKVPCLIYEITPEQLKNPNRCIFCNKIFTNKSHLTAHLKICKIKSNGSGPLVDKVNYEREIRILKEHMEKKDKQKDEQIRLLMERLDRLEADKNNII